MQISSMVDKSVYEELLQAGLITQAQGDFLEQEPLPAPVADMSASQILGQLRADER